MCLECQSASPLVASHSEFDIILREYIHFINIPVVGFILMVINIKYENAIRLDADINTFTFIIATSFT